MAQGFEVSEGGSGNAPANALPSFARLDSRGRLSLRGIMHDPYANRNSFVRSSLIVSRSLAAFSNSNLLAASRMSLSSFAM